MCFEGTQQEKTEKNKQKKAAAAHVSPVQDQDCLLPLLLLQLLLLRLPLAPALSMPPQLLLLLLHGAAPERWPNCRLSLE